MASNAAPNSAAASTATACKEAVIRMTFVIFCAGSTAAQQLPC